MLLALFISIVIFRANTCCAGEFIQVIGHLQWLNLMKRPVDLYIFVFVFLFATLHLKVVLEH